MSQTKLTKKTQFVLFLTIAGVFPAAAADDTATRLGRAGAVLNTVMDSGRGIRPEQIANADCIAVIPGFKKRGPAKPLRCVIRGCRGKECRDRRKENALCFFNEFRTIWRCS